MQISQELTRRAYLHHSVENGCDKNDFFDKQMHRKLNYIICTFTHRMHLFLNNALKRKQKYIPKLTTFYKTDRVGNILAFGSKSMLVGKIYQSKVVARFV